MNLPNDLPSASEPTKLDKIVGALRETSFSTTGLFSFVMSDEEAKQQIKDLMLAIIGEDDQLHSTLDPKAWDVSRNKLRAELRQKVEEL